MLLVGVGLRGRFLRDSAIKADSEAARLFPGLDWLWVTELPAWPSREPYLFVNVHLGAEMHSFIVANLGNRTTITRDLPRVPPLNLRISPSNLLRPEQIRGPLGGDPQT